MEKVPMKTLVIRGDAVMCIGLIDEDIDSQLDPASIRGEQLNSFQFWCVFFFFYPHNLHNPNKQKTTTKKKTT